MLDKATQSRMMNRSQAAKIQKLLVFKVFRQDFKELAVKERRKW